jgi:formylglycine-generating enzyme required for sulfatase activity
MGSPSSEWGRGRDDEEVRPITLTRSFEISEHETTQAEWTRVGFSNPSATRDWGKDCTEATCPVGNANWYEALAYANALSAAHSPPLAPCYDLSACTGQAGMGMECSSVKLLAPTSYECAGYRLPTEAEWEYAARAGTRSAFYSGDIRVNQDTATCYEEPNLDGIAWYCMNGQKQSHPVAGKSANGWGLYDVLGNVAEWVQDDKDDWVKLSAAGSTDPVGELDFLTSARVVRGGPVTGWSVILRSSAHFFAPPGGATAGPLQGFRLVRTLD